MRPVPGCTFKISRAPDTLAGALPGKTKYRLRAFCVNVYIYDVHVCVHATCACMHTCACMCVCMDTCVCDMCVCVCVCMHVCVCSAGIIFAYSKLQVSYLHTVKAGIIFAYSKLQVSYLHTVKAGIIFAYSKSRYHICIQ